ncbi:helix-turn-helix domain-containing protein [Streptomyces sp. NBC_00647]
MTRGTLDRWARHYRAGGFPALVPAPRQVTPRTPVEVLDLAAALKKENPARTAAQIQRIADDSGLVADRPDAAAALR